mgnify:CR=1 FL=1
MKQLLIIAAGVGLTVLAYGTPLSGVSLFATAYYASYWATVGQAVARGREMHLLHVLGFVHLPLIAVIMWTLING